MLYEGCIFFIDLIIILNYLKICIDNDGKSLIFCLNKLFLLLVFFNIRGKINDKNNLFR